MWGGGSTPALNLRLAGGVESLNPDLGVQGWGCWTSPGKHNIRERLSRGEEGKDDPVHHPFHLKAQRVVSAGVSGEHSGARV